VKILKSIDKGTRLLRYTLLLLILLSVPVSARADRLPWTGAQRYIFAGADVSLQQPHISASLDIFTGDFPYAFHLTEKEFTFYTGMPYFRTAPFLFSIGAKTQAGFFDYYRVNTLFQSASFGWDITLGADPSLDFFLSHSLRFDAFTAGWAFYGEKRQLEMQSSISLEQVSFYGDLLIDTAAFKPLEWSVGVDLISKKQYSLRLRLNHDMSVTAAFGLAHRTLANDKADEYEWDFIGAHRGSLVRYPENSRPALEHALSNPQYRFVETDLNLTLDGKYAAIHDPILLRYTGERKALGEMNMDELKTRDVGSFFSPEFSDVRILELDELAELFDRDQGKHLMIELKYIGEGVAAVERAVRRVQETFEHENYSFMTLYHDHVEALKGLSDEITWGFCYLNYPGLPMFMMLHSHFYPLLEFELEKIRIAYDPDFIILFMDTLPYYEMLKAYAITHGIDIMFWDFKDTIYGISADGGDTPVFIR
jgi:hypothetical protein